MSHDDPLEELLVFFDLDLPAQRLAELHAESYAGLEELAAYLDHPPKFLYLFDYGDGHQFEIQVVGIQPQASSGKYPRVIDSQGKSPEEYDSGEE